MGFLDRLMGRGKGRGDQRRDILDLVLCQFSEADPFTLRDACEGVQIFGGIGSGKTSGSGAALARSYLAAGFGGLVLTAKTDEAQLWQRYCAETGRTDDLLLFRPGGPLRFNFLEYELTRSGQGAGLTENLVQLFMLALETGGRSTKNTGGDPFWADTLKELLRNAIDLVALATGSVSLSDIYELIEDAPQSPEQVTDPAWQKRSACAQALLAAEAKAQASREKLGDYRQTERYWTRRFPQLSEKTRSIIVTSFTALTDAFLRHPMRELFCSDTTVTPEASLSGKVIVLDFAVKEWGEVGVFAQALFKLCWQKAVERRPGSSSRLPVFLWADECQYFLTSYDQLFQTTARSSLACTVYLTQNLPNYYAAFGGEGRGHAQADSLLGNLQTKIFHANGCAATNEWASKLIAQTWQSRGSFSSGGTTSLQGESSNNGFQFTEQLAAQVLPVEFTVLKKGGTPCGRKVESVVFQSGRIWKLTEANHIRVTFPQE